MPAASSSRRSPRRSSRRRAIPTRKAWSTPCRGSASARATVASACARSRAWCRRSRPIPRAAASIRVARPSPISAAKSLRRSRLCRPAASCGATIMADTLLALNDLAVHFTVGSVFSGGVKILKAVDGVTFDVKPGECLGLVGESGCGKSTLALAIMGLVPPTEGGIALDGRDLKARARLETARTVQMVFQDPYASLNPRQTVRRTLADPLRLQGVTNKTEVEQRVMDMLTKVGLRPEHADRYPHEFSGGQRQRIGIARALILQPKLVICDEPVSALDVSIRAQIINLLLELKDEMALAYILISHDLGVVEHVSDRVAVMYLGRIVEQGSWQEIFENPRHPYTRALIAAIPDPFHRADDFAKRAKAHGEIASALNPPPGCHFNPRCPMKADRCVSEVPLLEAVAPGHRAACQFRDRTA